jgi:aryl-alcohol dehydrogenase-like predicted oxidoreductase
MFDFSKEKIVAGFEESLERLGLDYVDVLQVGESPIYSFELFTLVRSTI